MYRKQVFVGKISALLNPLTYIIINLGIVAILWIGGDQVFAGRLSQGQVIALINYMSQILVELIKLANLIILMSRAAASLKRVNNVFDMHSTLRDGSQPFTSEGGARISFHGVSFTYAGAKEPSLSDITFTAEPGQTIGIIGGTGSGKTTLVNLIPRFYDATGGTVTVNGRDVRQYQFDSPALNTSASFPRKPPSSVERCAQICCGARRMPLTRKFMKPWTPPRPGNSWIISSRASDCSSTRAAGTCPAGRSSG